MLVCLPKNKEGRSKLTTLPRLSLDAIRVPDSVFLLSFLLALWVGIYFVTDSQTYGQNSRPRFFKL